MVSKLKASLKGPCRDALVEHLPGLLLELLLAADRQPVLVRLDREISLGKASHGDRDAVCVLTGPRDVVGRIARHGVFHAAELRRSLRQHPTGSSCSHRMAWCPPMAETGATAWRCQLVDRPV